MKHIAELFGLRADGKLLSPPRMSSARARLRDALAAYLQARKADLPIEPTVPPHVAEAGLLRPVRSNLESAAQQVVLEEAVPNLERGYIAALKVLRWYECALHGVQKGARDRQWGPVIDAVDCMLRSGQTPTARRELNEIDSGARALGANFSEKLMSDFNAKLDR